MSSCPCPCKLFALVVHTAHVDDGKGSFNSDNEDGGGDNEDWGDDDGGEDFDKKNTGKREQAITLVQLRSSRPSSTR